MFWGGEGKTFTDNILTLAINLRVTLLHNCIPYICHLVFGFSSCHIISISTARCENTLTDSLKSSLLFWGHSVSFHILGPLRYLSHSVAGHLGYSLDLIFTEAAGKTVMFLSSTFFLVAFLILCGGIDIYSDLIWIDGSDLASCSIQLKWLCVIHNLVIYANLGWALFLCPLYTQERSCTSKREGELPWAYRKRLVGRNLLQFPALILLARMLLDSCPISGIKGPSRTPAALLTLF